MKDYVAVKELQDISPSGNVEIFDYPDNGRIIHFDLFPNNCDSFIERNGISSGIEFVDGNVKEYTIRFPKMDMTNHRFLEEKEDLEDIIVSSKKKMGISALHWDPYIRTSENIYSIHLHGEINEDMTVERFVRRVKIGVEYIYSQIRI